MEVIVILLILWISDLICFYINPYLYLDINFSKKQQKQIYRVLDERIKYNDKYFD